MTEKIDMSLDDIIKRDHITAGRGRGRGGRGGRGARRGAGGSPMKTAGGVMRRGRGGRPTPYSRPAPSSDKWQHDMFEGGVRTRAGGAGGLAHLMVSNLDFGVTDADISELFAELGYLRKASVHYDRSGRSLGTADVVYERRSDAVKAMNKYNGVPLDGRPMKIQLVSGEAQPQNQLAARIGGGPGQFKRGINKFGSSRGGGFAASRGRGRGRGRGGGAGGQRKVPTAEELDAELDAYTNKL